MIQGDHNQGISPGGPRGIRRWGTIRLGTQTMAITATRKMRFPESSRISDSAIPPTWEDGATPPGMGVVTTPT